MIFLKTEGKLVLIIALLTTFAPNAPSNFIPANSLHFRSYHVGQRSSKRCCPQ